VIITKLPPDDIIEYVSVVTNDALMYIPLAELIDPVAERERLKREITKTRGIVEATEVKLSNEQFVSKAPEHVINTEREKLAKSRALLDNLIISLENL
jgi:valyl-tRNA synthetase